MKVQQSKSKDGWIYHHKEKELYTLLTDRFSSLSSRGNTFLGSLMSHRYYVGRTYHPDLEKKRLDRVGFTPAIPSDLLA